MNHFTGGAFASVLSQLEIPPEVVNLGAVGIVAFAAAMTALALLGIAKTATPLIKAMSAQFAAMNDSNAALLKRLEASDAVIERNTVAHTANAAALDRVAADSKTSAAALSQEVVTIRTDVSKLGLTVSEQLDALKAHITETGNTNTEAVISEVKKAAVALDEIKTFSRQQNDAVLTRVNEVEQAIIAALNRLALPPPTKQTTETAVVAVTKKIETGKLPAVTELVKPTEPKDPAA